MKYSVKKTVSEVVIDFEDECVIKLTKFNIDQISTDFEVSPWSKGIYHVTVCMTNGISFKFKTSDDFLIKDINLLISN